MIIIIVTVILIYSDYERFYFDFTLGISIIIKIIKTLSQHYPPGGDDDKIELMLASRKREVEELRKKRSERAAQAKSAQADAAQLWDLNHQK